jgi:CubicO group peptidase (beta-lactamase class C family)
VPHDPAARRLGLSGHAGAFGTLAGVVDAVQSWLDGAWLPERAATDAVTCQTHATPGGHRSLAWTLAGDPYHAVAHDWPPTTLCHTGFTGVSVALDPVSRWWAVYLSNAIPVARDAGPILVARRHFHAAAAAHLRTTTPAPTPA